MRASATAQRIFLFLACHHILVKSLSITPQTEPRHVSSALNGQRRRDFIISTFALLPSFCCCVSTTDAARDDATTHVDPRAITSLRLNSFNDKAGLTLKQVTLIDGTTTTTTPPRTVVAVEQVVPNSLAAKAGIQEGLIVLDYENAKTLIEKIKNGPFPIELQFYNLAAGGDAFIGDYDGTTPLVTARDALQLSTSTSFSKRVEEPSTTKRQQQEFAIRVMKEPPALCQLQSRRGNVLEILYQARYGKPDGPVYDSSTQRGTGQPYQFVLGSGDMIPGVDQGLQKMCPGEIRLLEIPPALGYGIRASKLYGIPPQSPLYWTVELVSVNSVRVGDTRDREE